MLDALFSFKTLWYVLIILYVPACISLIVIVLLQKGKGTGFAGAFGAGAGAPGSDAVFGPKAGKSMPVRLTYIGAAVFMVIAVIMSMISGRVNTGDAPALDDVSNSSEIAGSAFNSTLTDRGIGTGVIGQAETGGDALSTDGGESEGTEGTDATEVVEETDATEAVEQPTDESDPQQ